jgi:hypothetical protein
MRAVMYSPDWQEIWQQNHISPGLLWLDKFYWCNVHRLHINSDIDHDSDANPAMICAARASVGLPLSATPCWALLDLMVRSCDDPIEHSILAP